MKYRRRSCLLKCIQCNREVTGRGRVYSRLTKVKCRYKPSASLL